jgi:hypothetical protein
MSTEYFIQYPHSVHSSQHHTVGDKASLSKHKKIEIISCILCDCNALKLELNNKNNSREYAKNWKLMKMKT